MSQGSLSDFIPSTGPALHLAVIPDRHGSYTYVVRGRQSFYISDADDMVSCMLGSGTLQIRGSIFRTRTSKDGVSAAIAEFVAAIDDSQLLRADGPDSGRVVDLKGNTRPEFWAAGSGLSSQAGFPQLISVGLADGVLTLRLRSDGGRYEGTFLVDWSQKTLVRSVIARR